jgi:hypothetical protein
MALNGLFKAGAENGVEHRPEAMLDHQVPAAHLFESGFDARLQLLQRFRRRQLGDRLDVFLFNGIDLRRRRTGHAGERQEDNEKAEIAMHNGTW